MEVAMPIQRKAFRIERDRARRRPDECAADDVTAAHREFMTEFRRCAS